VKKKGSSTYTVPVEIRIPIAQLTSVPGSKGLDGKFRVVAVAAGPDGNVSEVSDKAQAFHIPEKEVEKAKAGAFTYSMEIVVRDTGQGLQAAAAKPIQKDGHGGFGLQCIRSRLETSYGSKARFNIDVGPDQIGPMATLPLPAQGLQAPALPPTNAARP